MNWSMKPAGQTASQSYVRTKKTALLAGVCVATMAVYAGIAAAQAYRVTATSVEGNRRVDDATVLSYGGLTPGQVVYDPQLNEAYQKILASGLFEDVRIEQRGGRLLITVQEFPTINKISFEGNRRIKDEDLSGFIESSSRQIYSASKAERDAQIIAEAYQQNGRIAARVQPKIIRRSDNRVDLVFEIFEGQQIEVQRIGFVGNRNYTDRRLRRVIDSKQAGLFRALISSDVLVADRLEFDKQLLTDFYNSRGYVDFRVTGVNAELAQERDTYFVTFNVQEGQQFKFGTITTTTDRSDVDPDQFQSTIKVRPGAVYSPALVEAQIARMERLAIREGIDFLRIEPRITRNERDLTLDVEFELTRGPKIFVERIDIEGNTTTLDRVIRRQFDIAEGDPFNPRAIRAAADRIRALNYFSNVEVDAREGEKPNEVVIDVDVEETTTGSVSFGAGYSSSGGVGLSIGFSERNFLGRGQRVSASINTTSDVTSFGFRFVEPAFLERDVAFGLNLQYSESDSDYARYDTKLGVFRPSLEFPVSEAGRLNVYYNLEYQNMNDYRGDSGILEYEVDRGTEWLSAVGYNYTYDSRRVSLDPKSGYVFSFGQRFAGVGGDLSFVETQAKLIAQTLVLQEEVTLRATFEGGMFNHFGSDDIRAINRYTSQIIRGFEPNGIGPVEADEQLGGNKYAAAKFEALFPLGLPDEYGISGGIFYDIGAIWDVKKKYATSPVESEGFSARHVIGASLFWESPFGPLRFNVSQPIKKKSSDDTQNFDLTVSTEF